MPSLIIHFFLWTTVLIASLTSIKKKNYNLLKDVNIWIAIILASFVIGLRWENGGDFANYYSVISSSYQVNPQLERFEIIPRYLIVLIHYFDLPYSLWFVSMALFQFVFILLAANNGLKSLFPWMILLYFFNLFPLSLIIIRQIVALTVILYAYTFINKKKPIIYIGIIILAFCFHRTALICLPFYWIIPRINIKSTILQIVVVIFFIIFGESVVSALWSIVPQGETFRYSGYIDREFDYNAVRSGLGILANYIRYFIIILYSNELKNKYKDWGFNIFYTITYIFICLAFAIRNDQALSRASMYLGVSDIITTSILFYELYHSKKAKDKIILATLLLLISGLMISSAYKGSSWQFVLDM